MKKLLRTFVVIIFSLAIVGCQKSKIKNVNKIKIGVVETTGDKYKSFIHWYDENLEVVDDQKL